jgi:hypothetical protein
MHAVRSPEIEVISGLTSPSAAENLLLDALRREVRISLHQRLNADALGRCQPGRPLLLVVPVLGDNDLRNAHLAVLTAVSQNPAFASKKIVIVLHGDRHVWDAPSHCDPVNVKLRNAFYFSTDLHLHPEKLDIDTAASVAQPLLAELVAVRATQLADFGAIAMALGKAPVWDAARGKLDFYDEGTGFSRLYGLPPSATAKVLHHVSRMPVTTLLMNNASLGSAGLTDVSLNVRRVDLGGNLLGFADAMRTFPRVEWLGMAANSLVEADLAECPATLEHVYLHKNTIERLQFPSGARCKLKELSLYRNRLSMLGLPDDQTELQKVNLGANPIAAVPDGLRSARGLRFLGIARTNITSLPGWLRDLECLRQLDISYIEHQLPAQDLQELAERGIELIRKPGYHP